MSRSLARSPSSDDAELGPYINRTSAERSRGSDSHDNSIVSNLHIQKEVSEGKSVSAWKRFILQVCVCVCVCVCTTERVCARL